MGFHQQPVPPLPDIPPKVEIGPGWSPFMCELADHIGARDVLRICEALGGRDIYVPADPERSPFLSITGLEKAKKIAWIYRGERLVIPTAYTAINRARLSSVLPSIRAGELTVAGAARILGMRRDSVSRLVNRAGDVSADGLSFRRMRKSDQRQIDMFPAEPDAS